MIGAGKFKPERSSVAIRIAATLGHRRGAAEQCCPSGRSSAKPLKYNTFSRRIRRPAALGLCQRLGPIPDYRGRRPGRHGHARIFHNLRDGSAGAAAGRRHALDGAARRPAERARLPPVPFPRRPPPRRVAGRAGGGGQHAQRAGRRLRRLAGRAAPAGACPSACHHLGAAGGLAGHSARAQADHARSW